MDFPQDLKYTKDHEWTRQRGDAITVGITSFAVDQLGDITLIELPAVGDEVTAGDAFGTIESVKSVSDLYAPVSGTVSKINETLEDQPELVNSEPYGVGWLLEITPDGETEGLLDAAAYKALTAEG